MTWKTRRSGAYKLTAKFSVAPKIAGVPTWKEVARVRIWKTLGNPPMSGWRDFYVKPGSPPPPPPPPPSPPPPPPTTVTLAVGATPLSISGTRVGPGIVTTNITTLSVSGGVGPYTYSWSLVSFSGTITPTLIKTFSGQKLQMSRNMAGAAPESQSARAKCVVKDTLGNRGVQYVNASFLTTLQSGTGGSGTVGDGIDIHDTR